MDCLTLSPCVPLAQSVATMSNHLSPAATADSRRAQVFAELLAKNPVQSHVYVADVDKLSPVNSPLVQAISSVESLSSTVLTRLERNKADGYLTQEKTKEDQFMISQELVAESMRFQVEAVSIQLMSSVLQATRQGVSTLLQQQG
jgi:hypothetical protein